MRLTGWQAKLTEVNFKLAARTIQSQSGPCCALIAIAVSLTGCTDNFCFGCTSPGEPIPLEAAHSIMRYRIYDPASQTEYASGCKISRLSGIYPSAVVTVPLGVEYAADIYAEFISVSSPDAGPDTRSDDEICADDFVFYTNGVELTPGCLSGFLYTTLTSLYPIDMSGAPLSGATINTQGGARFTVISDDYGPAEFMSGGSGCPDTYGFGFWEVVASN